MLIKITSEEQVVLPAEVLKRLRVRPGDHLELKETREGFIIKPKRQIDLSRLDPLADKIPNPQLPDDIPPAPLADKIPPDHEPFDLYVVRERMAGREPRT